ncbi:MAG: hypothetical protein MUC50_20750, partial [Myxococcota bacterium]|nr:hypothetical protein [Myxococcota bacterium]
GHERIGVDFELVGLDGIREHVQKQQEVRIAAEDRLRVWKPGASRDARRRESRLSVLLPWSHGGLK